ncbi:tetratricopeptide repeat-containing sensor histidine kinase [Limnovirga soli]|uniref:histidine kinase n=1 Tax=Limnovirga soli TaxID=2656915 RepID=A0A8J8FB65_9BACT|nr:tetratricopeptide repeat protein [Limnovirga soli]NNV54810.1 tetratricopeptide repeat protein [Limnovirga soli]
MRKIIIILCIIGSMQCYSQNNTIDSLTKVLQSTKVDTTRINTLNWLAYQLRNNDPDSAVYFANKAFELATKTNYKIGVATSFLWKGVATMKLGAYDEALKNSLDALKIYDDLISTNSGRGNTPAASEALNLKSKAYNNIGLIYRQQGNYEEALKNNFASLKIRTEIDDKAGIATSYSNIGLIYYDQGNSTLSLKYDLASLKIRKEIGNKKGIADCYNNIGLVYEDQGNYPEALKSYLAALKIDEELGDKASCAILYGNIGIIHGNLRNYPEALNYHFKALKIQEKIGDKASIARSYNNIAVIYIYQKNYTEALKSQLTCLKITQEIGDKGGIAEAYFNIGVIYGDKENYEEALKNYVNALKLQKELGNKAGMTEAYIEIGNVYTKQKKSATALDYLSKGLALAKEIGNIAHIQNAYKNLVVLDSTLHNFEQALEHYKLYITYHDSLYNEENTKKIVQSQMQFEFDKKEAVTKADQDKKDADAQRIKNQQYFAIAALGIIVLAVIIIAIIQYKSNQHKRKANLLLQEEKLKVESTLSELKAMQAQLIQQEKMASLGELTAGIAHEIQNPLNFVNNFSELNKELIADLKDEIVKGNMEEVKSIADDIDLNSEKINHHGKRAEAIVKGMLQHSRQMTGTKELTNINGLADEYLRLSYHGLRAKDKNFNAEIITHFDETLGSIQIIPQDIGRVLLNLYNNAFYAVAEKKKQQRESFIPTVSVSTKKAGDKVEIRVSDNGNGIPQKIVDKIFQPFFTTKPTGQGTGLGLSLSYDIIKAHGGELKVDTIEGEETTFIITL